MPRYYLQPPAGFRHALECPISVQPDTSFPSFLTHSPFPLCSSYSGLLGIPRAYEDPSDPRALGSFVVPADGTFLLPLCSLNSSRTPPYCHFPQKPAFFLQSLLICSFILLCGLYLHLILWHMLICNDFYLIPPSNSHKNVGFPTVSSALAQCQAHSRSSINDD